MPESRTATVAKYQSILFDTEGQIAIVTLNRPQRRNASVAGVDDGAD